MSKERLLPFSSEHLYVVMYWCETSRLTWILEQRALGGRNTRVEEKEQTVRVQ
jgi:hypothetical protein